MFKNEKDIAQQKALQAWERNQYRGSLAASVGFGKSKVAIDAIRLYPGKWLLVAPTHTILQNWSEETAKWNLDESDIDKICYASLAKTDLSRYDGIVLDELHRNTENNTANFDQISPLCAVLGLTGTEPVEQEKIDFIEAYCPIVFKYDVNMAVEKGLVSDYRITCISVSLDNEIKYIEAGNKTKRFYQTEQQAYDYANKIISNQIAKKKPVPAFMYLQRKQKLDNFASKSIVAEYVLNQVRGRNEKVAVFAPTIQQAEQISPYTYHSKTNDEHLEMFKRGEVRELATVNALNEGVSVPGIESGVIFCLNSKDRNFVQRLGRVLRRSDGKPAQMYVVYFEGTTEEKYLKNSLESLDASKITYQTFDGFKNGSMGSQRAQKKEPSFEGSKNKQMDLFAMR